MSASEPADADAAARERALEVAHSFIVQAPAGSGKTTVLTQRYLRLLTTVDEPEQVLAITFTRKAAGEMRDRVQRALAGDIAVKSPADQRTLELAAAVRAYAAARDWAIDESLARLRIQTIDAFHGYLANALPVSSQNGFGRAIAEDPADLYALAAREAMRTAESEETLRPDFERILRRLDDGWLRLERLIAAMLPRRAEWLPFLPRLSGEELVPRIEQSLAQIVAEELTNAVAALPRDFPAQAEALARFAAAHLTTEARRDLSSWHTATAPLGATLEDLPRWRVVAWLALTQEGGVRRTLNKTQGIPPGDAEAKSLKDAWLERLERLEPAQIMGLGLLGRLPDPRLDDRARGALDALARLLLLAAVELQRLFRVHGECDHTEIAGAARRALTEDSSPTPLAERLGTTLRHILVDEFQDTSRDQYELLRTLTQDWSEGDGRTVFLVGDPMQSIYGFRNAEVGRFATVRAAGIANVPLEALELRRNFRSAPGIVDWCNQIFARVFPAADDVRRSAVRHLASVAVHTQLEGAPCVYRVEADDGAEARVVADAIAQLGRTRPTESIAVLAGARPHLRAVRAALAERGVPFIGVKLEPLADVAVVRDLEALARALDSPLDRIAWLAVLRAPFVGLDLADLTAVSDATADLTVPEALSTVIGALSDDGAQRLARAMPVLLTGWADREREARAHLVERTWLQLGGPACCHAAELEQARRFLAALDEQDRKRLRGRPADLARVMETLYAEDPAVPGAVSLMTIHGAKGLEFDHVFVVGVGRRGRSDEQPLLNWLEIPREEGGDHLVMAPIRVRVHEDDDEDEQINAWIEELRIARARNERARQAYVALTRAKRSLHVFVHPTRREKDGVVEYSRHKNSLLEVLWPALESGIADYDAVGAASDPADIDPAVSQVRHRLPARPLLPEAPPDVSARGELVPFGADDDPIEFSWARQTARRVGTVVHEALEHFGRGKLPDAAALPALRARLESRLEALGIEPAQARAGAQRALAALGATLADPRGRWLFDAAHRRAHSELALSGVYEGRIVNIVIDRTFIAADGTRWIVDFKSSPHEGGDLERFLDEEVRRYTAQLTRYARLARALGPEPVRAGLYFPLLGAWREVEVAG